MKKNIAFLILLSMFQNVAGQNTILWKVTDIASGKVSTIVGTFHHLGNSFVDSIPHLKDELLLSELAIFESIDNVEKTINLINKRVDSNDIEKGLKRKDLNKLKKISEDWQVELFKLKPIELRWKLIQEFTKDKCKTVLPTDRWEHFDNYLIHLAKENNISAVGLETDSFQLNLIEEQANSPKWKEERKNIEFWLKKLTTDSEKGDCIFAEAYLEFKLDYDFSKYCEDDIIIKQRNANWMEILPAYLKEKNCFIAVGYEHLKYECGLLEQLKEKGFKVDPIEIKASR